MYSVAIFPPIEMLEDQNLTHNWYADKSNLAGLWFLLDKLNELRGAFVYNLIKVISLQKQFLSFLSTPKKKLVSDVDNLVSKKIWYRINLRSSQSSFNYWLVIVATILWNKSQRITLTFIRNETTIVRCQLSMRTNPLQMESKLNWYFGARATPKLDDLLSEAEKLFEQNLVPSMCYWKVFPLLVNKGSLNIVQLEDRSNNY